MLPAYSIIFFTVASGAGYGLLVALGLAHLIGLSAINSAEVKIAIIIAFVLITAGLISSTAHLGHPQRAWRAFSQWRSSWLSREGVLAVLTYIPMMLYFYFSWFDSNNTGLLPILSIAIILLAQLTVFSTAMIYASLKPVPRWHHPLVPVQYLLFSFSSGALLYCAIFSFNNYLPSKLLIPTAVIAIVAWLAKYYYWNRMDKSVPLSTIGSATGLGKLGKVTPLDAPHTSKNYVQKEMGFVVARKHAIKLRRIALLLGGVLPATLIACSMLVPQILQPILLMLASIGLITALLVERWLFFAEAEHVSTLFYGAT